MFSPIEAAPSAREFPAYPISWYLFCTARDLRCGPLAREVCGRRLVAFRTAGGRPCVLDAHCSHLGADLGRGCVIGETIECPYHQWRYGIDGRCKHIPVTADIPATARQMAFPVVEQHGLVFFFHGPQPTYPFPFFPDARPEDFIRARPFGAILDCPWYMVGANGFDLQHFRAAHDRWLMGEPVVECPHPFARRATARFRVAGASLQDRLTRWFAGDEVEMAITDWCGTVLFATATFRRGRSYGMLVIEPLAPNRTCVQAFVFVPRSSTLLGRALWGPVIREVRRAFIKKFLSSDVGRIEGARYSPYNLIPCDRDLAAYFHWLSIVSHGHPFPASAGEAPSVSRPRLSGHLLEEGAS